MSAGGLYTLGPVLSAFGRLDCRLDSGGINGLCDGQCGRVRRNVPNEGAWKGEGNKRKKRMKEVGQRWKSGMKSLSVNKTRPSVCTGVLLTLCLC